MMLTVYMENISNGDNEQLGQIVASLYYTVLFGMCWASEHNLCLDFLLQALSTKQI